VFWRLGKKHQRIEKSIPVILPLVCKFFDYSTWSIDEISSHLNINFLSDFNQMLI
jgi:hypothetical protein